MKIMAILPVALAACAPVPSPDPVQPPLATECNPAAAATLVGKAFTEALAADAKARTGANSVRVIRPGMAVTMDYRSDRLNIDLDERGVVTRFGCS